MCFISPSRAFSSLLMFLSDKFCFFQFLLHYFLLLLCSKTGWRAPLFLPLLSFFFAFNCSVCVLSHRSMSDFPFVSTQLQDFVTSVTSSERCSISRGCERDQVGTSLSSLGHNGRMAYNRTSASTERHLLLFVPNGCCPFTYALPPQS